MKTATSVAGPRTCDSLPRLVLDCMWRLSASQVLARFRSTNCCRCSPVATTSDNISRAVSVCAHWTAPTGQLSHTTEVGTPSWHHIPASSRTAGGLLLHRRTSPQSILQPQERMEDLRINSPIRSPDFVSWARLLRAYWAFKIFDSFPSSTASRYGCF